MINQTYKAADRIDNINSMGSVFDDKKQTSYLEEAEEILAMITIASRRFPQQSSAFMNTHIILKTNINMIRGYLERGGNNGLQEDLKQA